MENSNEPARKADLAALEAKLGRRLDDTKADLAAEQFIETVKEVFRDAETKLRNAFYGDAKNEHRLNLPPK